MPDNMLVPGKKGSWCSHLQNRINTLIHETLCCYVHITENTGQQLDCWFRKTVIWLKRKAEDPPTVWCASKHSPMHHLAFSLQATVPLQRQRVSPPQLPRSSSMVWTSSFNISPWTFLQRAGPHKLWTMPYENAQDHADVKQLHPELATHLSWAPKTYDSKLLLLSMSQLENRVPLTCSVCNWAGHTKSTIKENKVDFQSNKWEPV